MWRNIFKASFLLACKFLVYTFQANCQKVQVPKAEAISFEIGKTGLIYNFNYDLKFKGKNLGIRAGMGSNLGSYLHLFSIGGGGYFLIGETKEFLELGLDIHFIRVTESSDDQRGFADIFIYPDSPTSTYYFSANIGHRRIGKKNLFRVGFSPGLTRDGLIPGGYVSFGFLL